jgi:hypothetical protein
LGDDKATFIGIATHRKLAILSDDVYDKDEPGPTPDTTTGITLSDFAKLYQVNPLVNKAINLKANRVMGDGFDLLPADSKDIDPVMAEQAKEECWKFLKKINYLTFFRQSLINAHVAGNEFTELIYNGLGHLISLNHGDFKSIDYRRDFLNDKVLLDSEGNPVGYWQYISDLSQLYRNLSLLYGSIESYENLKAAKERLDETRQHPIYDEQGNQVGVIAWKAQYMFLRKDEIVHLSINNLNDNWYGYSSILPAYDALTQLNQVMFATAEAINTLGYPKPVIYVGDKDHPPTDALNDMAEDAITDPVRKESFVLPYYSKLEYLKSDSASQLSQYPEWYVTAVSVGLRIPKEILLGDGTSNRSTAYQQGSDFEKDCEAERRLLEEYIYQIFDLFLKSRGYETTDNTRSLYCPQLKWNLLISEDEVNRERMILEKWNAGLISFNEARELLGMNEIEDPSRAEKFVNELNTKIEPPLTEPATDVPVLQEAQHALVAGVNDKLNKQFGTDVNMRKIIENKMGKKIKSVSKAKARKIIEKIVNGEATKESAGSIMAKVKKIGDFTDHEATRLLVTEQNNLRQIANLEQAKADKMVYKKWIANKEACPACKKLNGKILPLSANFEVEYEGRKYTAKSPSLHPECNCGLGFSNTAKFGKEYLGESQTAPEGVQTHTGPKGGVYYYTDSSGQPTEPGDTDQPKKINIDKIKEKKLEDFYNQPYAITKGIKDVTGEEITRENLFPMLYEHKKEELLKAMSSFKSSYSFTTPQEEIRKNNRLNFALGYLGSSLRLQENAEELKQKLIADLREETTNDTKQINTILKYMGFKDRVTKSGERAKQIIKSAKEISDSLKTNTYEGVSYKVSEAHVRNSEFKNEEELNQQFHALIDKLPHKARIMLKEGGTTIHFLTRQEASTLITERSASNVAGIYIKNTHQIYIYPSKETHLKTWHMNENKLKLAGYDEETIKKMTENTGNNVWNTTVSHEIGHAVAMNVSPSIQSDYDEEMKKLPREHTDSEHISRYSMKNTEEDLAETFAYYLSNKKAIDNLIELSDADTEDRYEWMNSRLKAKFKFMRDRIWQ